MLEGTSPTATISGNRITVTGPFAPGATLVNIGYRLAQDRPSLTLVQPWPAAFQQVTVGVQKIGALSVASPQFTDVRDVTTEDGKVFVLGSGPGAARPERRSP